MIKIVKSFGTVVIWICAMIPVARADLMEFDIDKELFYTQTDAAGSLTFNGAQFASRLDQTANAYIMAQLSSPSFPGGQPYTLNGTGTEFSLSETFTTKAAMDTAYPFGTYTATSTNIMGSTKTDVIGYTLDAYPSTQAVVSSASFTGLQGLNAAAPFTVNYNGFTPGVGTTPGQSFEFLDIFNSMGTDVFSQSFLPNTQMSVSIPAGTLMPGMAYILSLDYSDRIQGTSSTGTNILYDYDTSFSFTTAPAAIPAPLVGLPVFLAVSGILFGAKLLARGSGHKPHFDQRRRSNDAII